MSACVLAGSQRTFGAQEDSDGIERLPHLVTARCSHLPAAWGRQAVLQAQASAPPRAKQERDTTVSALGSKSTASTSAALQAPADAPSQGHEDREGDVETVEEVDISGPQHTVAAAGPGMAGLANNPAMMQQATSMMQNPAMMAQVSAGSGTAAVPAAAAAVQQAFVCARRMSKMQSS